MGGVYSLDSFLIGMKLLPKNLVNNLTLSFEAVEYRDV